MTTGNHRPVPLAGPGPRRRLAPAEPSWGRVLLTTVQLWTARRLDRAGGRRLGRAASLLVLSVAAVAAGATLVAAHLTGALAPAAAPAATAAVPSRPASAPAAAPRPGAAATAQAAAVTWIASQTGSAAVIGCYPAMCTALQAAGVNAGRMVPLATAVTGAQRADLTVSRPADGQARVDQYAPALAASFGTGRDRIEVRAVEAGGAAAYAAAARADRQVRQSAGRQLLANSRLGFTAAAAAALRAGQVDARLLATLAALSAQFDLRGVTFSDSSPGAALLYRQVSVASDRPPGAWLSSALAMVGAQASPYQPASATVAEPGTSAARLVIRFAAPSPLGLLSAVLTASYHPGEGQAS